MFFIWLWTAKCKGKEHTQSALENQASPSDIWCAGAESAEQLISEDFILEESDWREEICAKPNPFECKYSLIFIWGRGSHLSSVLSHLLGRPQFRMHLLPRWFICWAPPPSPIIFHPYHSPVTDAHIPTWVLNPISLSVRRIRMEGDFFDLQDPFMGRLRGEDGRRGRFPVYQQGVDGYQIAGNIIEDIPGSGEGGRCFAAPSLSC